MRKNRGFTLIEMLVVTAIIGILSGIVLVSINSARQKTRDAVRLADMRNIQLALDAYLLDNGAYPGNSDNDCSGWDGGWSAGAATGDPFIQPLQTGGYMSRVPIDATATGACTGYRYYRYTAGTNGCDPARGAYYVLAVFNMETSSNPHPASPGWSCSTRDWQYGFDNLEWVTGKFE